MIIRTLGDFLGMYTGDNRVRVVDADGNTLGEYENARRVSIQYAMCDFVDFHYEQDVLVVLISFDGGENK